MRGPLRRLPAGRAPFFRRRLRFIFDDEMKFPVLFENRRVDRAKTRIDEQPSGRKRFPIFRRRRVDPVIQIVL